MRLIKQLRHEIFMASRKMQKMVYKKGDWKKGLDKRDKRFYLRANLQMQQIRLSNAEGEYIMGIDKESYHKWLDSLEIKEVKP